MTAAAGRRGAAPDATGRRRVLVVQHQTQDHPAYLASWLERSGVAFDVRNGEAGARLPATIDGWHALALLGGEMSANDPLPWLRAAERLIDSALQHAVPVLGLCLGAQLMARALGMTVRAAPAPEIGWQPIEPAPTPAARRWFGGAARRTVFQWHYETFDLPPGATLLARSDVCETQAFALGPHRALQFHAEVDRRKLLEWTAASDARLESVLGRCASVQSPAAMRAGAAASLAAQQRWAASLFEQWVAGSGVS